MVLKCLAERALHRECGDLASGLNWDSLSDNGLMVHVWNQVAPWLSVKSKFPFDSGALWNLVTSQGPY